jgi:GTPase SAR1 family protein
VRDTFQNVSKWAKELREVEPDCVLVLVGNKCDLKDSRQISTENGQEYARNNSMLFVETSSLEDINVTDTFNRVLDGKELFLIVRGVYRVQEAERGNFIAKH